MKPASRQVRLRFVANVHHDLTVMGERHMKDLEQDFMSLIQVFEDKMTRLKSTLPKEFLQLRMQELHTMGNSFPEVLSIWQSNKMKSCVNELKSSLRVKKSGKVKKVTFSTPKRPRLRLAKRNSHGRRHKYRVTVEGGDNLNALIKQGLIHAKNIVQIPDSNSTKRPQGPITRSRSETIK
ncbi:hypothetical protein LOD99_3985 [Oopsacas minuta]|uniref:Uncharacterized protein n=1 Tax=Oopsacas minuta TaxID=111878 RepID=A0AAV7JXF7_9METZ|nr:hypothetical protein LOD99_3985 [Oopsacas minuta]